MKILGIDFGLSKMGLALSEGSLSEPYGIISAQGWEKTLKRICEEERIEKIVVGLAGDKIGEKQSQFGQKLAKLMGLSVEFQDETLTSQEALAKMRQIGKKIKDEDAIAAALILQSYLDTQSR